LPSPDNALAAESMEYIVSSSPWVSAAEGKYNFTPLLNKVRIKRMKMTLQNRDEVVEKKILPSVSLRTIQ